MSLTDPRLNAYPEVQALLQTLLERIKAILQGNFVGMYIYGSLALGAFNPQTSDVDFVVVTQYDVRGDSLARLGDMHRHIFALPVPHAKEIEASYLPLRAFRRHDPTDARHPHIDRGSPDLSVQQHDSDWVVQRYVLREHGIVVAGEPLTELIDPISPDDLRAAVVDILNMWWLPMLTDPTPLATSAYRRYAVLSLCRSLYTLRFGGITTKVSAAVWAAEAYPAWGDLIGQAGRLDAAPSIEAVQAFIRFVSVQNAARFDMLKGCLRGDV